MVLFRISGSILGWFFSLGLLLLVIARVSRQQGTLPLVSLYNNRVDASIMSQHVLWVIHTITNKCGSVQLLGH